MIKKMKQEKDDPASSREVIDVESRDSERRRRRDDPNMTIEDLTENIKKIRESI